MQSEAAPQSPRTAEEPMAFTSRELARGVIVACAVFAIATPVLAFTVAVATSPEHAGFATYLIIVAWLLGVLPTTVLVGFAVAPLARLIGRALRRRRRYWPHLLSYFGLGAVASLAGAALVGFLVGATTWSGDALGGLAFVLPLGAFLAPIAGASAATGWLVTVRRALAADRAAATW